MQLVILAAGLGSRFGGLKQIEPIDEFNNFIIDYSVYDAIEAGFSEVIFIIKKENYDVFRKTIGMRIEDKINVQYAFQEMDDIPINSRISRTKPWGTAHALYAARKHIREHFVIINADDYYGKDAFKVAYSFLNSLDSNSQKHYANVAFEVENTLTENGSVKRGVCYYNQEGLLFNLIESSIERTTNGIVAVPLNESQSSFIIDKKQLVSMNMFAFSKDFVDLIGKNLIRFLENKLCNLEKDEYLIPVLIDQLVKEQEITVQILSTSSVWYGVTYQADKEYVVKALKNMTDSGLYKKGLW